MHYTTLYTTFLCQPTKNNQLDGQSSLVRVSFSLFRPSKLAHQRHPIPRPRRPWRPWHRVAALSWTPWPRRPWRRTGWARHAAAWRCSGAVDRWIRAVSIGYGWIIFIIVFLIMIAITCLTIIMVILLLFMVMILLVLLWFSIIAIFMCNIYICVYIYVYLWMNPIRSTAPGWPCVFWFMGSCRWYWSVWCKACQRLFHRQQSEKNYFASTNPEFCRLFTARNYFSCSLFEPSCLTAALQDLPRTF